MSDDKALRLANRLEAPLENANDVADQVAAELRRLHAEIERLQQQLGECSGGYQTLEKEVVSLKAEVERLRALLHHVRGCLDPFVWEDECAEIDAALKEPK
jgi:chromosome segregation ATPase